MIRAWFAPPAPASRMEAEGEMTNTETPMPDYSIAPEAMSLQEVRRELDGQWPSPHVIPIDAYLARRRALWRRLDALTGPSGGPDAA
jgi:hypothetical protein